MIVVTGGAGFIGANIIKSLNNQGIFNILVVDDFSNVEKIPNLADCIVADYMDKDHFRNSINGLGSSLPKVEVVFHQGACSNTMATDGKYVLDNNYQYSKELLNFCQAYRVPFIYASSASVYGGGEVFIEKSEYERPLNAYAYSKLLFDQHVRQRWQDLVSPVIGLRYFNVYGYREQHKHNMASVAYHFYHQYQANQSVNLFEGTGAYGNGEQLRDFVFIEDVVDVNLHFWKNPKSGIYNLGTGKTQSFNDVALHVVNYCREQKGETVLSMDDMIAQKVINYIPFPEKLKGKYQSYTCADITALRESGFNQDFHMLADSIPKYMRWIESMTSEADDK